MEEVLHHLGYLHQLVQDFFPTVVKSMVAVFWAPTLHGLRYLTLLWTRHGTWIYNVKVTDFESTKKLEVGFSGSAIPPKMTIWWLPNDRSTNMQHVATVLLCTFCKTLIMAYGWLELLMIVVKPILVIFQGSTKSPPSMMFVAATVLRFPIQVLSVWGFLRVIHLLVIRWWI